MNPKVSAVITTKNRVQLLQRAVQSALDQTYPLHEIIVVDDASEDGTQAHCTALSMERPEIVYIRIEKQHTRGANHARNVGIEAASGQYIAFLDDDDVWLPEKIAKQIAQLDKHPDCIGATCFTKWVYIDRKRSYAFVERHSCAQLDKQVFERENGAFLYASTGITSALLIDKQALIEAGMFDPALCDHHETELTFRLRQKGSFCYVAEPLVVYHLFLNSPGKQISTSAEKATAAHAYIEQKHGAHFAQLTEKQKKDWALCKHTTCFERCARARSTKQALRYLLAIFKIDKRPQTILRLIPKCILPYTLYQRVWCFVAAARSAADENSCFSASGSDAASNRS